MQISYLLLWSMNAMTLPEIVGLTPNRKHLKTHIRNPVDVYQCVNRIVIDANRNSRIATTQTVSLRSKQKHGVRTGWIKFRMNDVDHIIAPTGINESSEQNIRGEKSFLRISDI